MTRRSLLLLASVSFTLVACSGDAGFGPERYAGRGKQAAPAYRIAAPVPAAKAVAAAPIPFTTRRIDANLPDTQNYEVTALVTRSGATADADEVLAMWMDGRPGSDGRTQTGLGFARTADGARTFEATVPELPPTNTGLPFDPMLAVDAGTGRVYRGAIDQGGTGRAIWVAASNDGSRFTPPLITANSATTDKGWLAAGAGKAGAPRQVALFYNRGWQLSLDGGASFSSTAAYPFGIQLPFPRFIADGTIGIPFFQFGEDEARFTRFESGQFSPPVTVHRFVANIGGLEQAVPGTFRVAPFSPIAHDPRDGRLYMVLNDVTATDGNERDLDVLLYRSDDGGATWNGPKKLAADAPAMSDQLLPTVAVDAAGRVHVAYLDTRRTTGPDEQGAALVDAWYAVSADGGESFVSQRLTEVPLDASKTDWAPLGGSPAPFVGDYIGLDVSANAAYVAYPAAIDGDVAMAMSRIDFANLPAASAAVADPRGLAGGWFDPATSGQGIETQWLEGNVLLVVFYGHRDDGANLFLIGTRTGVPSFGETLSIPLSATRNGRFGNFDPDAIVRESWGTLTLRFDDCNRAQATLAGRDGTQVLALQRIAKPAGLDCG